MLVSDEPTDLVSVPEAAREVGVATQTLYNRIDDGVLRTYVRPGTKIRRVSLAEVREIMRYRPVDLEQDKPSS